MSRMKTTVSVNAYNFISSSAAHFKWAIFFLLFTAFYAKQECFLYKLILFRQKWHTATHFRLLHSSIKHSSVLNIKTEHIRPTSIEKKVECKESTNTLRRKCYYIEKTACTPPATLSVSALTEEARGRHRPTLFF